MKRALMRPKEARGMVKTRIVYVVVGKASGAIFGVYNVRQTAESVRKTCEDTLGMGPHEVQPVSFAEEESEEEATCTIYF